MRRGVVQDGRRNTEKNELKPHLQKQWCIGALTSEYAARMENILHLHSLPYNEKRPVVDFDELPVQLLNDCCAPLPLEAGKPKRVHYEYERRGTACLLVACEPLTGRRIVEVSERRTKTAYCRFAQKVAAAYPEAERIVLIQDDLNTHSASSFYENLPPAQAFELMQRFEFHFTPKKASRLNIAEIELSALSRSCLARRISSIEDLEREVAAIVKERNEKQIKVSWQFTKEQARQKLGRHYEEVKTKN